MRTAWFFAALFLTSLLAVLQQWAHADSLYWRYVWFDIPMHYLGGLALGVFVIAFIMRRKPLVYVGALVTIAIGWEVYEVLIGTPREANYVFDTSLDILMDALGAITAYIVARFTIWRSV